MGFSEVNFRDYPVPANHVKYIGVTGSDTTGNGSLENPYKTLAKAYSGITLSRGAGSTAMGYIVFKDGVYDISRGIGSVGNQTNSGGQLYLIGTLKDMKNVTIMAQNPLKAFLDVSVRLGATGAGLFGAGTEYASIICAPPNITYTLQGTGSGTYHYFYGASAGNMPPEFPMIVGSAGQLPKFAEDKIPYPAMYGYDPSQTVEPGNWEANKTQWTFYRYDNNLYNLGMTYYFIPDTTGVTQAYLAQRTDLPSGFTWRTHFWDTILQMNSQFPNMSWDRQGIILHGGNNNNFITRTKGLCAALKAIHLEKAPTWAEDFRYWIGNGLTFAPGRDEGGNPDDAIGIMNKYFIKHPYQYNYEPSTGLFYYKQGDGGLPRVVSYARLKKQVFFLASGASNVTICGFVCPFASIFGQDNEGGQQKPMENFNVKFNLIHDLGWDDIAISTNSGVSGEYNIVGNCIIRSAYRSINIGRSAPYSNAYYSVSLDQMSPTLVHRNFCADWREGASLYQSGKKVIWSNNTCIVANAAHGDGMAIYQGAEGVIIKNNYFYTPGVIPIALNAPEGTQMTNQWLIEGNFFPEIVIRDPDDDTPWLIKNNVTSLNFTTDSKLGSRAGEDPPRQNDPWWYVYNKRIRNNALISTNRAFEFPAFSPSIPGYPIHRDSSWEGVSLPMPAIFTQEANKFASVTGTSNWFGNAGWTFTDGLPNFYNNVSPLRYPFDRLASATGSTMIFPYASTNTTLIENYARTQQYRLRVFLKPGELPEGNDPDIAKLISAYDTMFVDWTKGDFRLKSPYNVDMFGNAVGIGITRPSYNHFIRTNGANGITFGYGGGGPFENIDQRIHEWWLPYDDYGREEPPTVDADLNNDGLVNAQDVSLLLGNWGGSGTGDLNNDGLVNSTDLSLMLDAWSQQNNFRLEDSANFEQNHPITIDLAPTNLTENVRWDSIDQAGTNHAVDGIYNDEDIVQIPNILQQIKDITDPTEQQPAIGISENNEIEGNANNGTLEGGSYVLGSGGRDYIIPNTTPGSMNSFNVLNQTNDFMQKARVNGGASMAFIVHGKSDGTPEWAEFNYVQGQEIDPDSSGDFNTQFYKTSSWIAFNSKESITKSIISPEIRFRKSYGHIYIPFSSEQIRAYSKLKGLSGEINTLEIRNRGIPASFNIDRVYNFAIAQLPLIQSDTRLTINESFPLGTFNAVPFSSPSPVAAVDNSPPSGFPQSIFTRTNIQAKFNSFTAPSATNGLTFSINIKNSRDSTFFTGVLNGSIVNYPAAGDTGQVGASPDGFSNGIFYEFGYNIDLFATAQVNNVVRIYNDITHGTKNYLEYFVPYGPLQNNPGGTPGTHPAGGDRLFGRTSSVDANQSVNLKLSAGDYIQISGSQLNDGIYQVISVHNGIPAVFGDSVNQPFDTSCITDNAYNRVLWYPNLDLSEFGNPNANGSELFLQPRVQYLELSPPIVPEDCFGTNVRITVVSKKPLLHVKYRVKN